MRRSLLSTILTLALSIVLTGTFVACSIIKEKLESVIPGAVAEPAPNEEIAQAVEMGLVPTELQSDYDKTIISAEYCQMLKSMFALLGDPYPAQWEEIARTGLASDRAFKRKDAMLTVYEAACVLGMGSEPNSDWITLNTILDATGKNFDLTGYYPEWPNWKKDSPFTACGYPCNYMEAAYLFAQGQTSLTSGKRVFEFDETMNTLLPKDEISRADAIVTVLRFYESLGVYASESQAQEIVAQADARRESILNSETTVSYTGTAYYVSADGSDQNNGLSPETAWQTIDKVNENPAIKPGDAVFFRRGDTWRDVQLFCTEYVTYSAYGEGVKPRFYGSPESGAGGEKWTLYRESNDGTKIWEFHRDMPDTGGVVFNGGESWADRIYAWWGGEGYVQFDQPDEPFTPEACLTKNHCFCSMPDFTGCDYPIARYDYNKQGPLYLRCDEGNPGEVFGEIEFETTDAMGWNGLFTCIDGCTIDNLSFLYWGNSGVSALSTMKGITIQNCEIGWGGNCIHMYIQQEPTLEYMESGDGIYGIGVDGSIVGNYCHDIDGSGIAFEAPNEFTYSDNQTADGSKQNAELAGKLNYRCADNLIERCGQGIWMHDDYQLVPIGTIVVDNNWIQNIGEGYCHGCNCPMNGLAVDTMAQRGDVLITNNTVYRCVDELFYGCGKEQKENNAFFR